jgi:hypothetical protein
MQIAEWVANVSFYFALASTGVFAFYGFGFLGDQRPERLKDVVTCTCANFVLWTATGVATMFTSVAVGIFAIVFGMLPIPSTLFFWRHRNCAKGGCKVKARKRAKAAEKTPEKTSVGRSDHAE